jgi:hypothetical protein
MSSHSPTDQSGYRPAGYCPKCSYATDVGVCPECGYDIRPGELEKDSLAVRRRRIIKRVSIAGAALVVLSVAITLYNNGMWVRPLPNGALLTLTDWHVRSAGEELARRIRTDKLSTAELQWLIDHACDTEPPALKPSYPRDYPLSLQPQIKVPPGLGTLRLRSFEPALSINGELISAPAPTAGHTQSQMRGTNSLDGTHHTGLPPGTHTITLDYQLKLLFGGWQSPPLTCQVTFPITVADATLDELVTLRPDQATFQRYIDRLKPRITFTQGVAGEPPQEVTLDLSGHPTEPLAVMLSVRAGDGEFRPLYDILAITPTGFIGGYSYQSPEDVGNIGGVSGGSVADNVTHRMTIKLKPAFAAEVAAAGGLALRLKSDPEQTRELGFAEGHLEMITGEVILEAELERPAAEGGNQ